MYRSLYSTVLLPGASLASVEVLLTLLEQIHGGVCKVATETNVFGIIETVTYRQLIAVQFDHKPHYVILELLGVIHNPLTHYSKS